MKKLYLFARKGLALAAVLLLTHPKAHSQSTPKLSDPEIASAAVTANQVDIGYAEIALKKSKNDQVIQFAQTMKRDHSAVIDQAVALAKKLNVTPKTNAVTEKLMSDATKTKQMLDGKSGAGFDKAYIDNEVTYHKAVIQTVQDVLIPQTSNGELKQLLQNVVPALKAHLEHAEMIQKSFHS